MPNNRSSAQSNDLKAAKKMLKRIKYFCKEFIPIKPEDIPNISLIDLLANDARAECYDRGWCYYAVNDSKRSPAITIAPNISAFRNSLLAMSRRKRNRELSSMPEVLVPESSPDNAVMAESNRAAQPATNRKKRNIQSVYEPSTGAGPSARFDDFLPRNPGKPYLYS